MYITRKVLCPFGWFDLNIDVGRTTPLRLGIIETTSNGWKSHKVPVAQHARISDTYRMPRQIVYTQS